MYTGLGEKEEAQRVRENMLELRDSLRSYAISEDLHQIEMKRERRDMQERMALAEYRAREKDRWLAGITVFALVILYLLLRIRKSNRRLPSSTEIRRRKTDYSADNKGTECLKMYQFKK